MPFLFYLHPIPKNPCSSTSWPSNTAKSCAYSLIASHVGSAVCFDWQAAALAEFRADWSTAVKTYQTAYGQVQKVQLSNVLPLQHWFELTSVAEEVHIKVGLLLLALHLWWGIEGAGLGRRGRRRGASLLALGKHSSGAVLCNTLVLYCKRLACAACNPPINPCFS